MMSEVKSRSTHEQEDRISSDVKRPRVEQSHWPTSGRFLQAMLATRVDRFFSPGDIIFVADRDNKVVDVWKGLVEHNFLAVPVLQHTEPHRYYGFLVMSDIVRELVKRFSHERLRDEKSFWERMDESLAFGTVLVKDIMQFPLSRKNPFHPISSGYSLLFALELMAREEELHRVPIVDADRNLVNLITQVSFHLCDLTHSQRWSTLSSSTSTCWATRRSSPSTPAPSASSQSSP